MRRADLAERIDTVEHRMDSMEQRLDASFNALSTQILQSRRENDVAHLALRTEIAGEFSTMRTHFETALSNGLAENRHYMRVLYEDILSRIALLGEGRLSSS